MGVGTLQRHYINIGGTAGNLASLKWGFRAPKDSYKNIAAGFGVVLVDDNNQGGIAYGCNQPKAARVRISYKAGSVGGGGAGGTGNDVIRSVRRFCEYDLLNNVCFGSSNGLKVFVVDMDDGGGTEYDIDNVSLY